MGDKNLLKQILKEQQKTNELLQTIVSSKEQANGVIERQDYIKSLEKCNLSLFNETIKLKNKILNLVSSEEG